MKKLLFIFCFCVPVLTHAELPSTVSDELQRIGLPTDNVSVYVQALAEQPAQLKLPLLAHQSNVSLNPASTMKLVTSYAGLALLGPNYRWKTEVYTDGALSKGVLDGNLYLKASNCCAKSDRKSVV